MNSLPGAVKWIVAAALCVAPSACYGSLITFDESLGLAVGFNGQNNDFLISTDGQYRVEFFWLNAGGHAHLGSAGLPDGIGERNHNNSGGTANSIQGMRITRVDNGAFTLVSADIFGQAAIGDLTNFTTGAGTFALFNGSGTSNDPGTINFGAQFAGVTSLVFADPGRAGGNSSSNDWDNLNLVQGNASVPEPASLAIFGLSALAFGVVGYRRRKLAR